MQPERRSARNGGAKVSNADDQRAFVTRLAAGDVAAYRELLEAYWLPLVAYAKGIVGSTDAAEDAVQEVFIRVWQKRALLDPGKNLRGFFYRSVRNAASDEVQRRPSPIDTARHTHSSPLTPADITEFGELEEAVRKAVEQLPERRREVFVLAHFHDLSHREIAEILGVTVRTVKNHMNRALHDLRVALQPYVDQQLKPLR